MAIELLIGGNVIGVGVDIIDVDRIRKSHERHAGRFLDRIYTKEEQAYCMDMKNPYPRLAARFAAKEAISKAFTTGIGEHLGWLSMSITKGKRDEPMVLLDKQGKALLAEVGGSAVLISLSHTDTIAQAFAVIVRL